MRHPRTPAALHEVTALGFWPAPCLVGGVLPRRLLPGQSHSATRRVRDRAFLLRPSQPVNEIVLYALGVALQRHDVDLHALVVESNHVHTNLTDRGETSALPDFFRDFHALSARALNAHYGRGENFWKSGSYDNVELRDKRTIEEQLLYTWTNPIKDGLVDCLEDWPGVKFGPEDFGRTFTVQRPQQAFFGGRRPDDWEPTYPPARKAWRRERHRAQNEERRQRRLAGTRPGQRPPKTPAPRPEAKRRSRRRLPEQVTFTIPPPPGYEHLPIEEVRAHFRRLLDERVALILQRRQEAGFERTMGADAVRAQDPFARAGDTFPTFARNPRIACLEPSRRVDLLLELQAWRQQYRAAFELWTKGDRTVEFPRGCYGIPRWHAAKLRAATGPPVLV